MPRMNETPTWPVAGTDLTYDGLLSLQALRKLGPCGLSLRLEMEWGVNATRGRVKAGSEEIFLLPS